MAHRKSKILDYLLIALLVIEIFTILDFYLCVFPLFSPLPKCRPGLMNKVHMYELPYSFIAITSFLLAIYSDRKWAIFLNFILFLFAFLIYAGSFCYQS